MLLELPVLYMSSNSFKYETMIYVNFQLYGLILWTTFSWAAQAFYVIPFDIGKHLSFNQSSQQHQPHPQYATQEKANSTASVNVHGSSLQVCAQRLKY